MAFDLKSPFTIFTILLLFTLTFSNICECKRLLTTTMGESASNWLPADATWYGSEDGAGSTGGACGYGDAVGQAPFSSLVSAGGPSLYKSGEGCGACYQIMCSSNAACSEKPVTVVITDECPGGACAIGSAHFDLSGTSFGAMANSNQAKQLRSLGQLSIQYRKVVCNYPSTKIVFVVDSGSNSNYLAVLIKYEDGDGELKAVDLKTQDSVSWQPMQKSWGAVWKLNSGSSLHAPFSFRLTSLDGKTIVATGVIPSGWAPGQTYRSLINFDV